MKKYRIGRIRKNHQKFLELCFHHRELLAYRTLPELFSHSTRIKEYLHQQIEQKKTISLAIEYDDELAGVTLFHNLDFEERSGQLSMLLLKEIELKELEDMFRWMLTYGFNELNLHRIYGYVRADKTDFVSIIDNCGLSREAQLSHAAFYNGEYGDLYAYFIAKQIPGTTEKL